jgi:hypothetical protein
MQTSIIYIAAANWDTIARTLHLLCNRGEKILQGGSRGSVVCGPQMSSEWKLAYRWRPRITNLRQAREAAWRVSYLNGIFAFPVLET